MRYRIQKPKRPPPPPWVAEKRQRQSEARRQRLHAARALATHTPEEWAALVEYCGGQCVRCGSDGPVQKDHIRPLYRGGSDGIENLQPLCRPCNCSKTGDETDHRPVGWQHFVEMRTAHVSA